MAEESLDWFWYCMAEGILAAFPSLSRTGIQCFAEDSKGACLADKPKRSVLAIV